MTPILRPCKCGSTPVAKASNHGRINIMRVECKCGAHGATIFYTKPEQEEWARQTVVDGWNLRLTE